MTILWITVGIYTIGTRVLIVVVLTKSCMVIDVIIAGIDPIMCIHHITLLDETVNSLLSFEVLVEH